MENNLIATRYCLDNEDERNYSELFKQIPTGPHPNPEKLLKIPKNFKGMDIEDQIMFSEREKDLITGIDPISNDVEEPVSISFYQREEDLKPNEFIITISKDMMNGKNLSEEYIEDLMNKFYHHPLQIERFPSIQEAVERLCEELKNDRDYYRSWKDNIAMSFKDYFREYINSYGWVKDTEDIHTIANQAADNFLKQLTR